MGTTSNSEESIDFAKLLFLTRRSLIYIVFLMFTGLSAAYLVVRYTKPLYQSNSIIKLNFKNEATNLGLISQGGMQQDLNDIAGEIELIKSKLFLTQVANQLDYDVALHVYGTYLTDEKYNNRPVEISYKIKDPAFYDFPFDLDISNEQTYTLSYRIGDQKIVNSYRFGELVELEKFNIQIAKTAYFSPDIYAKYFFTINSMEAIVSYLENNITVAPENFNAKTLKISFTDFNKYKAREFVNAIVSLYLHYTTETKNIALEKKLDFLKSYISDTEQTIKGYEDYFENFTIDKKTVSLEGDISRTINILNALDSQLFNLQIQIDYIEKLQKELNSNEQGVINPFIAQFVPSYLLTPVENYQELLIERNLKLSAYNENTLAIRRINDELQKNRDELQQLMDLYITSLHNKQSDLKRRRTALEANFVELPAMGTEFNKNKQQYALQEKFLMSLLQSKMELEIVKAGTVTDSVILSPASLPNSPIKPQKLIIYGIGFIASLLISLAFIIIRYFTHNKISSVRELERLIDVPVIGTIPFYSKEKLPRTRLVIDKHSKSAISEALRTLRTNMEFVKPKDKTRLISITSTISGEGKTFIAVNLGAIIASTGQRICIVDLDMRKPKVHLAFGDESSTHGMSTYLIGKSRLEDCVKETDVENLFYMGAGPTPPNPSELILSTEFNTFLVLIKEKFDLIILDTPPVGLVTDGVLAMKKADIQLYVLKSDYSRRVFIKTIRDLQRMNKFKELSLILNGVKSGGKGYGYGGYGYGYGYGYGSGYYEENVKPGKVLRSFLS